MRFLTLLSLSLLLLCSRGFSQAVIRPGDIFEMRLTGMPIEFAQDFSGQYTVGDDGNVSIPLIGAVKASGLSATQVGQAIDSKLVAGKIFTHPTAVISLQPQSRTVTVGGAVRAPQAMAWAADLKLSSAIMRAGGVGDFGTKKKIKVARDGKIAYFNLTKADKDPNQDPSLMPGDVVEVPE